MIEKSNVKDIYPLSPMQEGMLFHALQDPASRAYFEQVSYRVTGPLSVPLFAEAWNYLAERHDILRTAFLHERTKRPLQVVLKQRPIPVSERDLRGVSPAVQQRLIAQERAEDKARGFDLREDSLLRACVFHLSQDQHEILVSFHHILMDGWCMGVLNAEFLQAYDRLGAGASPALAPAIPFQRYIQWLERQDRTAALAYWQSRLADLSPASFLSARVSGGEGYRLEIIRASADAQRLRETATRCGVTLNALFHAAWALVLSRYAGQDDVVFGAVVSGRPAAIPDVDRILGLFINVIPVRACLNHADDAYGLARQLHDGLLEALPYSHSSISEVAALAGRRRGLFDHIMVFENYPDSRSRTGPLAEEGPRSGALEVECTAHFEQTNYNFAIVIAPGDSIDVAFHYNANVFERAFVERLQANYLRTLELLAANPPLKDIDVLSESERLALHRWSQGSRRHGSGTSLVERFEQQAQRTPHAVAVRDASACWTYAELNARADALATRLEKLGVGAEDCVAVLAPRSRWLPLALIGVMKAGAVYLPIDPETPAGRIRFYQEDAKAKVLLTPADLEDLAPMPPLPHARVRHPDQLAYAIYTSGSTGAPKAVAISHRAAGNLIDWHCRTFAASEHSRATLFASPGFDASLWEMLPYLASGGCLFPVPEDARTDPRRLLRFYLDNRITHTFVPPAVCEELGRIAPGELDGVCVLAGGDVLRNATGFKALHNNYGPTESAVVASSIPVTGAGHRIPIGRPIDNTEILILDPQGRPAPIEVAGELHIASAGLARGYLGRPALTAESFVPHPHQPGERLYRTGDFGFWRDGAIHFTRRNDGQVKISGVRIELGEIEAAVARYPGVTEAAAVITPQTSLTAFIVSPGGAGDADDLRRFLSARLPSVMVPARFVSLPSLPRTRNGKVDRAALAATPGFTGLPRSPETERQRELAALWTEVLGVSGISLEDDFFALGGHSLTVTRLVSRIRDHFRVDLSLRAVFEAPTLVQMDAVIAARPVSGPDAAEPELVARRRDLRQSASVGKEV